MPMLSDSTCLGGFPPALRWLAQFGCACSGAGAGSGTGPFGRVRAGVRQKTLLSAGGGGYCTRGAGGRRVLEGSSDAEKGLMSRHDAADVRGRSREGGSWWLCLWGLNSTMLRAYR